MPFSSETQFLVEAYRKANVPSANAALQNYTRAQLDRVAGDLWATGITDGERATVVAELHRILGEKNPPSKSSTYKSHICESLGVTSLVAYNPGNEIDDAFQRLWDSEMSHFMRAFTVQGLLWHHFLPENDDLDKGKYRRS